MKYIFLFASLACMCGYIGVVKAPARQVRIRAGAAGDVIDCAPPFAEAGANEKGKFMNPIPGLGNHKYSISTQQDSARFYFNQGLNLYFGYHLRESLASFKEAARFDSVSAMLYWGEALAMGPYYNQYYYRMSHAVPAALVQMNRYRAGATEKERQLIDVMGKRYSGDTSNADRPELDSIYAVELRKLVNKYPADVDIKALYIDAVMLRHKWDFWSLQKTARPWTPELISMCEEILQSVPDHPAALHYYIHLTEASSDETKALAAADRLRSVTPGISHLVHMSTHMYQRNGMFAKGVAVNEDANDVANREDSLAPMLKMGKNDVLHIYAVQSFCAMNGGMYRDGLRVYRRVKERVIALNPSFEKDTYAQFMYMLPSIAFVRLGKWQEVLDEPTPDSKWKNATVLNCFAKGMASAHFSVLAKAKSYLDTLEGNLSDSLLNVRTMPFDKPVQCARIAAGILRAEILFSEGAQKASMESFARAVEEEDNLIYREPQQWFIPVRQYWGARLLEMNKTKEAEKLYREDLERNPGNGWSSIGLYQSLVKEKSPEAMKVKQKYEKAFASADVKPAASVFQ